MKWTRWSLRIIGFSDRHGAPTHAPIIKSANLDTTTGLIVTSTPNGVVFVVRHVSSS